MEKDLSPKRGTLIIFSWGAPARLESQIQRLETVPDRVVWVDPLSGTDAPAALADARPIKRIEAVLGAASGEAELVRYSLPDLYSLSSPTANLMSLLPGLKTQGTLAVPVIKADDLFAKLEAFDGPLQVVIDTPGQEKTVFDFLDTGGLFDKVETIALRCGIETFFNGAPDAKGLLATLNTKAFSVISIDDADPDWPMYGLKVDPKVRLITTLKAECSDKCAELEATIESLTKKMDSKDADIAKLRVDSKTANALADEKVRRSEHELAQVRTDLSRALQAQERAQADSDTLKARFVKVDEERKALRHLLRQLTPKLREAAKQVRDISPDMQTEALSALTTPMADETKKKKKQKRS